MPTIHLICEDATDTEVVQAILEKKSLGIQVRHVPMTGRKGGIARLAEELEDLIEKVREIRRRGDCIAVLHDADEHTQPDRREYDKVREICQRNKDDVFLVIARDAIEAWLLADEGLCRWLGIRVQNNDGKARPKAILEGHLKKRKMKWQGRDRAKVLIHIDGSGDQLSPSMREAVSHINC
jgi:hypothetical protein